jgi:hypothetical protein
MRRSVNPLDALFDDPDELMYDEDEEIEADFWEYFENLDDDDKCLQEALRILNQHKEDGYE